MSKEICLIDDENHHHWKETMTQRTSNGMSGLLPDTIWSLQVCELCGETRKVEYI